MLCSKLFLKEMLRLTAKVVDLKKAKKNFNKLFCTLHKIYNSKFCLSLHNLLHLCQTKKTA